MELSIPQGRKRQAQVPPRALQGAQVTPLAGKDGAHELARVVEQNSEALSATSSLGLSFLICKMGRTWKESRSP